jgi:hypothetical protein
MNISSTGMLSLHIASYRELVPGELILHAQYRQFARRIPIRSNIGEPRLLLTLPIKRAEASSHVLYLQLLNFLWSKFLSTAPFLLPRAPSFLRCY